MDRARLADAIALRSVEGRCSDQHRRHADQRVESGDKLRHRRHRDLTGDNRPNDAADRQAAGNDGEREDVHRPGHPQRRCDGDRHADHAVARPGLGGSRA